MVVVIVVVEEAVDVVFLRVDVGDAVDEVAVEEEDLMVAEAVVEAVDEEEVVVEVEVAMVDEVGVVEVA